MLEAALRRCYPVMFGVRRIIPNVLLMPAFQFRHPVAVYIHMKTNNLALRPARLRLHRLHISILRPFLYPAFLFLRRQQPPRRPLREMLHSVCNANKSQ